MDTWFGYLIWILLVQPYNQSWFKHKQNFEISEVKSSKCYSNFSFFVLKPYLFRSPQTSIWSRHSKRKSSSPHSCLRLLSFLTTPLTPTLPTPLPFLSFFHFSSLILIRKTSYFLTPKIHRNVLVVFFWRCYRFPFFSSLCCL